MKKKIAFIIYCLVFFSFNLFCLPGFKPFIDDVSGDYVFYKDYTFKRESYVGFLMYDKASYCARYFSPESKDNKKIDIKVYFTVNTEKDFMELTGEHIVSEKKASDYEVINYLHDMIYELNARRIKAGTVDAESYSYFEGKFLKQGKYIDDNFMQFGGDVQVVYDAVVPLFNLKAIYDRSGNAKFELVTVGRLNSSSDKSFDNFLGFDDSDKNKLNAKKYKTKKSDFIEYKISDNQSTKNQNVTQFITLDSTWNSPMQNMWFRGNEAFISAGKISANLSFVYFVKNILINAEASYSDWSTMIFEYFNNDKKTKDYNGVKGVKIYNLIYQNNEDSSKSCKVNYKIFNFDKEAENSTENDTKPCDYYFMILTADKNAYSVNEKYYKNIVSSYSLKK